MIAIALAAGLALLPGRYSSPDRRVEARVEQVGPGRVRVELVGGGTPDGAGTAADCALVVEGLRGTGPATLPGVPFTSLSQEVTSADLRRAPVAARLRPVRGGIVVAVKGSLPCGVGSTLDGRLARRSAQPGKTLLQN